MTTKTILMYGWRFVPHSFAVVCQFWLLEMLKRPDLRVYHVDAPYYRPHWKPVFGQLDAARERALKRIPAPGDDAAIDVEIRLDFPYDFSPSRAERLFVAGTSEFGTLADGAVAGELPIGEAMDRSGADIVTCSQWARGGFIDAGADPDRVHVAHFGFDPEIFHPADPPARSATRRRLGLDDAFVFLAVGAMTPNKGIDILLRAFVAVAERHPRARLVLKGLDSLYPSRGLFERIAGQFPNDLIDLLKRRIVYMGEDLSYARMAELYNAADAYVCPYLAEGFNLPALEAAACGVPVICTKGGPTDEFLGGDSALFIASKIGETSFESAISDAPQRGVRLIPDADHLATLMDRVASDEAIRERARRQGAPGLAERTTWSRSLDRLMAIILD